MEVVFVGDGGNLITDEVHLKTGAVGGPGDALILQLDGCSEFDHVGRLHSLLALIEVINECCEAHTRTNEVAVVALESELGDELSSCLEGGGLAPSVATEEGVHFLGVRVVELGALATSAEDLPLADMLLKSGDGRELLVAWDKLQCVLDLGMVEVGLVLLGCRLRFVLDWSVVVQDLNFLSSPSVDDTANSLVHEATCRRHGQVERARVETLSARESGCSSDLRADRERLTVRMSG